MPAKAANAPAPSFLAAFCIAAPWELARYAAAIVGSLRAALCCNSLMRCSSSSLALMELMPRETISMPRRSRHFAESSSFRHWASSVVWPGRELYFMPISLMRAKAGCSAVIISERIWESMRSRV